MAERYRQSIGQRFQDPSAIMPPHKRRRSVAFAPDDDDDDTGTREIVSPSDDVPPAEDGANSGVWDAFREEYHEGIVRFVYHSRR